MGAKWLARTALVSRLILGTVFLAAATSKTMAGAESQVNAQSLWDAWVAGNKIVAYGVLGFEFAIGAWLLSGIARCWAGWIAVSVLSAFTVLLLAELFRSDPRSCGCFGDFQTILSSGSVRTDLGVRIGFNVLMVLCASFVCIASSESSRDA